MSGTTRQKSLLELSTQSLAGNTNPGVRNNLEVYSISQVDAAISAVDLSAYTPLSTTESISGALNTDINSLETTVQDISGNLSIDIENLDISLTEAIFTHISVDGTSPTVTGSAYAWGRIDAISGGPLYVQLFK
jgi:hypothetical protein